MQRFILSVFAVALMGAGGTVFFVDRYIEQRIASSTAATRASTATLMVLVAKQDLPIGKKLARSDVEWQAWPKSGVQGEFVSSSEPDGRKVTPFIGSVARRGVIKGTPITQNAVFKSGHPGFLAGALDPNMRAMAVAVTAQSGAAGFILPGDRVDVILTQDARKKTRDQGSDTESEEKLFLTHVAETILQNVKVLAVDQKLDDFDKTAKLAKTVTLEVTRKQAETLAVATLMGKLSLAIRSLSDVMDEKVAEMARAEAVAQAIRAAKGPTTTTDIEVSPMLARTAAMDSLQRTGRANGVSKSRKPESTNQGGAKDQVRIYRSGQAFTVGF